jgi:hypothetical protein
VKYDKLIELTREQVEEQVDRPASERLMRKFVFTVFPYPKRLRAALRFSKLPAPGPLKPLRDLAPTWSEAVSPPVETAASGQKLARVVAPQAVHIALPGYGNSIIYLIHNVALVMYIGAADVMATAHLVMERDYNQYQFETYLVLAVLYSVLCLTAWLVVRFFELRSATFAPSGTPVKAPLMASV